jgi:hypothetical protein
MMLKQRGFRAKGRFSHLEILAMGLFKTAKEKAQSKVGGAKAKKSTTWVAGSTPEDQKVSDSIKMLASINAESKALEAKKRVHAALVVGYAERNFISDFSDMGVLPDTPMKVVNADGDSVTYVVQDRSGQYDLKPEQIEALTQILGEDVVENLLYTEHKFSFNREIMAIPGVAEAVEKALMSALKKLVSSKVIDEEAAGQLIEANEKTAFKPHTLDRAAVLVGGDKTRLKMFIDAMGSSCCRYIK